ncbi:MAG: AzlC family ABC transporter permease [Desulfobacteraceae bacterium]|nr:AzlC family ABC transporter permease [Desulfobacteraceae bacterium]
MDKGASLSRQALLEGLRAVWPVCFGYLPLGLALGVLAQKSGMTPLETGFMSLFVFAGSGQFIAVSMLAQGAGAAAIIMTTFMVNLRHLLMSSSLSIYLGGSSKAKLTLFSLGIVDETFAVNMERFINSSWDINRGLVVNFAAWSAWIASTVIGGMCGQFVEKGAYGIDYALIAMFIGLLVFQLKGCIYWVTGLLAGVIAVAFSLVVPGNSYIVVGSVLAATLGVVIRRTLGRHSSHGNEEGVIL